MEEYIGIIKMFTGTFCPKNYAYCNGQLLNIIGNEALYSIIGTQYGGDGARCFALPNLNKNDIMANTQPKYIICVNGIYPPRD